MPTVTHEEFMKAYLVDPEMAAGYLNAAIETGNVDVVADAFRDIMIASDEAITPELSDLFHFLFAGLEHANLRLHVESMARAA